MHTHHRLHNRQRARLSIKSGGSSAPTLYVNGSHRWGQGRGTLYTERVLDLNQVHMLHREPATIWLCAGYALLLSPSNLRASAVKSGSDLPCG